MRYIKLTEELRQKALKEFQEKIFNERFSDTKINFSFNLQNNTLTENSKAIVNIRPEAWLKMWSLVASESGEIGWHGLVEKKADRIFEITDIILYPQFVTGTTVQTDDVGYGNWLHKELSDDEINALRFHGHSHVNMSTVPSGVDTTWYNDILQGLSDDDFYIFAILNKREDVFIEIYDLASNTIYEKNDIVINVIMEDNNYLQNWVTQSKKKALQTINSTSSTNPLMMNAPIGDEAFEDLLLNISSSDFKDKQLVKGLVTELNKQSVYTHYFNKGWMGWHELTDIEKIEVAQNYYLFKNPNNASPKQPKNKKKQISKPKRKEYDWEDYYDQYY